jgi:hypothetical protein
MPEAPPPRHAVPDPVLARLPAGTDVWRAHHERFQACLFNRIPRDSQFTDGRFSGMLPDPFGYCYIGLSPATALMERHVRSVPYSDTGYRAIRRAGLEGGMLSRYALTHDLDVVSLCTEAELAAVCQDEWLLRAEGHDHAKTRRWGQWIRQHTSRAQGLLWPAKREVGGYAVVLFEDRCPNPPLRLVGSPLRVLGNEDEVNEFLAPYRVVIPLAPARTRLSRGDGPGTIRA